MASRAFVLVKFPDDEVRWTIFNGTSDLTSCRLFPLTPDWWDLIAEVPFEVVPVGTIVPSENIHEVVVYNNYGWGSSYEALASKEWGFWKPEYNPVGHPGMPPWVVEIVDGPTGPRTPWIQREIDIFKSGRVN